MAYLLSMFAGLAVRVHGRLVATAVLTVLLLCAPLFCMGVRAEPGSGGQAGFDGQYDGIADAAGMELSLQDVSERLVGRFTDSDGTQYAINGRRTGDTAQGALTHQDKFAYFHMEVRPLGLQFLFIPRAADGKPNIEAALEYSFVQRGVNSPETTSFEPPPGGDVDILVFAEDFRKWSSADVARIYGGLSPAYRTLLQLFDHASAELLWRVCETLPPNSSVTETFLTELLAHQNTNCAAYLGDVETARASGLFDEFIRKANFQFGLVRETVNCDRGRMPETKCADISVLSGALILRWRDAPSIMRELERGPLPVASLTSGASLASGSRDAVRIDGDLVRRLPLQRPDVRLRAAWRVPRVNPRR